MATVFFSEPAENELKRFTTEDQQMVADAVVSLANDEYRERNRLDLNLKEGGYPIFGLIIGRVWFGFHEDNYSSLCVDWVFLRSMFRP